MNWSDIKRLLQVIEEMLDWGDPGTWQIKDFEKLSQRIFEKTKISLSESTLRRVWGRVEYNHLPSVTTLDTLSRFAGFESWRTFMHQKPAAGKRDNSKWLSAVWSKVNGVLWLKIALLILIVTIIGFVGLHSAKVNFSIAGKCNSSFTSQPLTRSIPNSVIFNYDVKTCPSDSVFIQQSWDEKTRTRVDKNLHQFTSVYYRPGYYQAKLVVDNNTVKEHALIIPTKGWLGLIANQPVPVYLDSEKFISREMMSVPTSVITQKNIQISPQPPLVEYYNVGNFQPVPLKDFSFSTAIKNGFHDGSAACEFVAVILITDDMPIMAPFSAKGCVSELKLMDGHDFFSGKTTDLSRFGTDMTQWVKFDCRSNAGKIKFYVNDKLAYESAMPLKQENIVGICYMFKGTGSVRNVLLKSGRKIAFQDY